MSQEKPVRRRSRLQIPAWAFILFCVLYDELLLHIWISDSFVFGRFVCVLLFAVAFGLLLAFLCSLGGSAVFSRILAIVFAVVFAVLFLIEYFCNDAYKTFMTLRSILTGAGDVVGDFGSTVLSLVFKEFWRILLVAAPIVLYAIFAHRGRWGKAHGIPVRCFLALGCILAFALGYFDANLLSPDSKKYKKEYNFTNAVYAFGLSTALRLDISYGSQEQGGGEFVNATLPSITDVPETSGENDPTQTTEAVVPLAYNEMDIDFAALAESESNSDIASLHKYVASLKPSKQNEYTGLFKGKNLIFITAEAFAAEVIDEEITPTLYRLATKGIHFTDYYQPAWGGSTSTGEYSNLVGLVPTDGVDSIQDTIGHNMYFTIGNQLLRQNYTSYAYHNNTYDYYSRDETHPNLGYSKFIGVGNGMEEGVKKVWPESDLEMFDYTAAKYLTKTPFNIYYMTVSGHCLYSQGGNSMSNKNYDEVADLDCSETVKCYYAANLELEHALASLLRQLKSKGILDDTVIVLGTDHYPYGLEKSATWGNDSDYLGELYGYAASDCFKQDHSGLIIWSGSIEDMGLEVTTPVYSLDILPTLSNLFGVEYDSRLLVGRDVFSDQTPLVLWPNYSWKTDKGSYNSSTGTFTPADGETVSDDYVDTVTSIVKNKISFSRGVLNNDYYGKLFD